MFMPAPIARRTTAGQRVLPPNMYRNFAIWLKIWSMLTPTKSANINSATGRMPASAAPPAAPMIADSEIGVSMTRSAPNFGSRPLVTPKIPPEASRWPDVPPAPPETSSPSTMIEPSRSISRCSASFSASRNDFCGIAGCSVGNVDVGLDFRVRRRCGGLRRGYGRVDFTQHFFVDRIERCSGQPAFGRHARAEVLQAVHRLALALHLVLGAVELRVAFEVAVETRDRRLERGRTTAAACEVDQAACGFVDGEEVRAVTTLSRHAEGARAAGDVLRAHRVILAGVL